MDQDRNAIRTSRQQNCLIRPSHRIRQLFSRPLSPEIESRRRGGYTLSHRKQNARNAYICMQRELRNDWRKSRQCILMKRSCYNNSRKRVIWDKNNVYLILTCALIEFFSPPWCVLIDFLQVGKSTHYYSWHHFAMILSLEQSMLSKRRLVESETIYIHMYGKKIIIRQICRFYIKKNQISQFFKYFFSIIIFSLQFLLIIQILHIILILKVLYTFNVSHAFVCDTIIVQFSLSFI